MEITVAAVPMLNNQPLSYVVFTPPAVPQSLNNLLYKNKLQEYTQKSSLPFPVYQTVKEGPSHAPIFRSTVCVNGVQYISSVCFTRKAAEQDAARVALSSVPPPPQKNVKDDGCPDVHPFINEDTTFCKSILNEYASKKHTAMPVYATIESWEKIPIFSSSVVLNGITYSGYPGRNKKEAEQLASRAAVLSILDSENGKDIYEVIRSKLKLYAAINGLNETISGLNGGNFVNQAVFGIQKRKLTDDSINVSSSNVLASSSSVHEFKKPRADADMASLLPLIAFVPEVSETPPPPPSSMSGVNVNGKKKKNRKRNKKKAENGLKENNNHMSAAMVVYPPVNPVTMCRYYI